eukprot:CAMPEP_0196820934 /NCGR_PEP_ID=MMETSP1362-20130617/77164_1 /TAXON_ID=163516 /ORGANISM="Leptocylindrus danicus, Strain CCMP1856" /LENGTH=137 /DNA_ID=CAMNT_0042199971 /DNA_START=8 /DNA_END=421 /DNA_ORIENTATION=-
MQQYMNTRPMDCTSVIRAAGAMSRVQRKSTTALKMELKNIIVTLSSRLCSPDACSSALVNDAYEGRYLLHVAIDCGVQWSFGLEDIYEKSRSVLIRIDPKTNMYPFMMTAAAPYSDVECTFRFLKACPDVLNFCSLS